MNYDKFYSKWLKDAKKKKPTNYASKQLQLKILSQTKENNEQNPNNTSATHAGWWLHRSTSFDVARFKA